MPTSDLFPPMPADERVPHLVADIAEHLGQSWKKPSLKLRRDYRIRSVQASLQIEGNALDLEQVTAVLAGKRVLALAKDLQEAHNALAAYERLPTWQAHKMEDLLQAHAVLMHGLLPQPGAFRRAAVGIQKGEEIVFMAPPAARVPTLMRELFRWLENCPDHPLILSCRFHYEFEFIHPFTDGNGRLGRLWQTLLLAQWRKAFAFLPVETLIRDRQAQYYAALNSSNQAGHCLSFVVFMLEILRDAVHQAAQDAPAATGKPTPKPTPKTSTRILALLRKSPTMSATALATELGLSLSAIKLQLASLQRQGLLRRAGPAKGGSWVLPN